MKINRLERPAMSGASNDFGRSSKRRGSVNEGEKQEDHDLQCACSTLESQAPEAEREVEKIDFEI